MKVISPLLQIQNQLRIFHWQTKSYAQHKAFGNAYEALDDLVDNFIEVFLGKYGNTKANPAYKIQLENLSDDYLSYVDNFIDYLNSMTTELDEKDTDLLNIRDEMVGELNKLKYLLSLS